MSMQKDLKRSSKKKASDVVLLATIKHHDTLMLELFPQFEMRCNFFFFERTLRWEYNINQ